MTCCSVTVFWFCISDAVKNLSELLGLFKDSGEASAEQLKPIPVVVSFFYL